MQGLQTTVSSGGSRPSDNGGGGGGGHPDPEMGWRGPSCSLRDPPLDSPLRVNVVS